MGRPAVAVLAAGLSTRFGGNKLEAMCAGKPLGRWAIEAAEAAELGPGIIVTGPERVSFAPGWRVLVNPQPADGLGSSLAIAARYALFRRAPALLVLLADMPLVFENFLRALAATPAPAATYYLDGHLGVPALLDRAVLEQAAKLTGDYGAGALLRGVRSLPAESILQDVDTPEDLAKVERQLLAR